MRNPRRLHELAYYSDWKGNVWSGHNRILSFPTACLYVSRCSKNALSFSSKFPLGSIGVFANLAPKHLSQLNSSTYFCWDWIVPCWDLAASIPRENFSFCRSLVWKDSWKKCFKATVPVESLPLSQYHPRTQEDGDFVHLSFGLMLLRQWPISDWRRIAKQWIYLSVLE